MSPRTSTRPYTLRKSGDCTAPASANLRSLVGYGSAGHLSAGSWANIHETLALLKVIQWGLAGVTHACTTVRFAHAQITPAARRHHCVCTDRVPIAGPGCPQGTDRDQHHRYDG